MRDVRIGPRWYVRYGRRGRGERPGWTGPYRSWSEAIEASQRHPVSAQAYCVEWLPWEVGKVDRRAVRWRRQKP